MNKYTFGKEVVRTLDEINEEVARLKSLRNKIQKYNNAGDPNREIIDAEIHLMLTGESIYKRRWFYTEFSKLNVSDWMTEKDEVSPSDLWEEVC